MARKKEMQQAIKNFMHHHENGETIKEIAARYEVSYGGLLSNLGEIAEKNGVKRISLLQCPEKSHIGHIGRGSVNSSYTRTIPISIPTDVDPPEFKGFLDSLYEDCQNLITETEALLNAMKEEFLC